MVLEMAQVFFRKVLRFRSFFLDSDQTNADNQLTLAQLSIISLESTARKFDILKRVDVDYCITDQTFSTDHDKDYSGYTCLHFAAKSQDADLANELLGLGADPFKQGFHDGYTALHVAVNELHPCRNGAFSCSHIYDLIGELQDKKLVDILLSAHVSSHDTYNPKCFKNEISHLHIACMFDHTEVVQFFLKHGEPINQATSAKGEYLSGYTPLHFAVRYSAVRAVEILLRHGADVNLRDAKKVSALDLMVQRLMSVSALVIKDELRSNALYDKEFRKMETIIKLVIQMTTVNARNGLHIACTLRDKSLAESFLQQNVDVDEPMSAESEFWDEWRPLHFAAHFNVDTFNLLLKSRASCDVRIPGSERTPLDLVLSKYSPEVTHSILSVNDQFKDLVLSDQRTKLSDLILVMYDCQKLDDFLRDLPDVNICLPTDSKVWPGYTLLHLVVSMDKSHALWESFRENSHFHHEYESLKKHRRSEDEEETMYRRKIDVCLERGCDVSAKNTQGSTVVHFAYDDFSEDVVEKLLNHCKSNATDPDGLTHFHVACALGKVDLARQLLADGADVNKPTNRNDSYWKDEIKGSGISVSENHGSTPLHLAVNREKREVVELLLENGANIHAEDSLGLTPIHCAFLSTKSSRFIGRLLLRSDPNLRDSTTNALALSYLHVAAHVDDGEAVEKLLRNGASVEVRFEVDMTDPRVESLIYINPNQKPFLIGMNRKTALRFAVEENSQMAVRALLRNGADVHSVDSKGQSVIQYALRFDKSLTLFARKFKRDRLRATSTIDETGLTLLHIACASFDIKWAKKLLRNGADPNARIRNELWYGATPLHVLVFKAKGLVIGPRNFVNFAKLLIKYGADVTAQDERGFTALHLAVEAIFKGFRHNRPEVLDNHDVEFLLPFADFLLKSQKSHHVNPVDSYNFSHFHYACMRNDIETTKKFLRCNNIDVSQATNPFSIYMGFTPLHFAVAYEARQVAYLLIERGADVGSEDAHGNTPLHVAVKRNFVDFRFIETLVSHGADIDARNLKNQTPLCRVLRSRDLTLERLEFFLNRGCTMNISNPVKKKSKGILGSVMRRSVPEDLRAIFKKLIGERELQMAIANGFNFIHNIVSVFQVGELSVDDYLEAIEELMKIGYDFDKRDADGRTALHCATKFRNYEAIEALLRLGADLNIRDNDEETPFTDKIFGYNEGENTVIGVNTVKALAYHVMKMRLAAIDIDETNEKFADGIQKRFPLTEDQQLRYLNELLDMESTKFNDRLHAKNFMSELGAVAEYPRMYFVHRERIDEYFRNTSEIRQGFPEFCGLLVMQYRKALRRMEMWQSAKDAFLQVCSVDVPILCVEAVLRFFKTSELKILVESVDSV